MPNFLWPDLVETCTDKVLNDKDSPMDMAYGITQEDVLFAPGIRVSIGSDSKTLDVFV